MNSEQNKPNYSRQRCLFKSLLRYGLQVQHHASSRPRNSSSSKRHGQILNIPLMHTCSNGRPRLSRHHERQVPFHRFKFSLDGIHINTVLVYQFQAPFPVLIIFTPPFKWRYNVGRPHFPTQSKPLRKLHSLSYHCTFSAGQPTNIIISSTESSSTIIT